MWCTVNGCHRAGADGKQKKQGDEYEEKDKEMDRHTNVRPDDSRRGRGAGHPGHCEE